MREGTIARPVIHYLKRTASRMRVVARGEWWEPVIGRFWPSVRRITITKSSCLVRIFERSGFVVCDTDELEPEFEKIAIYGSAGAYAHAARQLNEDGTWTSKLGTEDDINHATLQVLVGPR